MRDIPRRPRTTENVLEIEKKEREIDREIERERERDRKRGRHRETD